MTALIDSIHSRVSAGSGSFSSTSFNQFIALRSARGRATGRCEIRGNQNARF
jgi:hypothetical protein